MTREEALRLLEEHLRNKNIVKHCLALEVVMRAFAEFYGEDPEKWAMAGLLHDLDYEKTAQEPQKHGIVTEDILKEKGVDQKIIDIIQAHNSDVLGTLRDTKAKKVIYSADPLTGLIVACALIRPEKKLTSIDTHFVLNRF
ncbi:MAG: HDIG domain-containing metalloprotein, partial [Patescibacteria group bacterium]